MTILVAIQNNLFHYISPRTLLAVVNDILGDFWSSFITTLVLIEKNLGDYISFTTFLVKVYDIWGILVVNYDNNGSHKNN